MDIKVMIAQQYGQQVIVPHCEKARLFAELARTRTLTKTTLDIIKQLGYRILVIRTEPEEL